MSGENIFEIINQNQNQILSELCSAATYRFSTFEGTSYENINADTNKLKY
jgi:hypothetical protein